MRTVRLHQPYLLLQLPLDVSSRQEGLYAKVQYIMVDGHMGPPSMDRQTWLKTNFPQIHWQVEMNRVKVHPAGTSVISAFSEGFYNDGPWGNIFWNIHKWPTHLSPWHPLIFIFLILFYIYKLNKHLKLSFSMKFVAFRLMLVAVSMNNFIIEGIPRASPESL